jgi:hypothetical protein
VVKHPEEEAVQRRASERVLILIRKISATKEESNKNFSSDRFQVRESRWIRSEMAKGC